MFVIVGLWAEKTQLATARQHGIVVRKARQSQTTTGLGLERCLERCDSNVMPACLQGLGGVRQMQFTTSRGAWQTQSPLFSHAGKQLAFVPTRSACPCAVVFHSHVTEKSTKVTENSTNVTGNSTNVTENSTKVMENSTHPLHIGCTSSLLRLGRRGILDSCNSEDRCTHAKDTT